MSPAFNLAPQTSELGTGAGQYSRRPRERGATLRLGIMPKGMPMDSSQKPFGYKPAFLTIRPRLPYVSSYN